MFVSPTWVDCSVLLYSTAWMHFGGHCWLRTTGMPSVFVSHWLCHVQRAITCRLVCGIHVCGHCGKDNIMRLKNEERSIVSICVCGVHIIVLLTSFGFEIKCYTVFLNCFCFPQKRNHSVNKKNLISIFLITTSMKTVKVLTWITLTVNLIKSRHWIPLLPVNPFSHTRLIYGA